MMGWNILSGVSPMRWLLLPLVCLTASTTFGQSDPNPNPTFLDRKKSDWLDMLKTDENARRRKTAIVALTTIAKEHPQTSKEIFLAFGKSLKNDTAPGVRIQVANAFSQAVQTVLEKESPIDWKAVILDLSENVRVEKDPEVRKEVATALGLYGSYSKTAVPALMAALKDPDASVRAAVVDAFGRIGADAKSTSNEIIPLLKDTDVGVRTAAIFALGRIQPEDSTPAAVALIPLVTGEKDPELRKMAITSLCFLSDRSNSVVQSIAAGLKDENTSVRQRTAQVMRRLDGSVKTVEAELSTAIRNDTDDSVRSYAIRTLCEGFGADAKGLLPLLVERMKAEKSSAVKIVIAEELGGIGAANALSKQESDPIILVLREAQRNADAKLRETAAEALKRVLKGPTKPKE